MVRIERSDKYLQWSDFYLAAFSDPEEAIIEVSKVGTEQPTIRNVSLFSMPSACLTKRAKLQPGEIRKLHT
jgi:hypothetical protein